MSTEGRGQFADLRAIGVLREALEPSSTVAAASDFISTADWHGVLVLAGTSDLGEPAVVVEPPGERDPRTGQEAGGLARRTARLTGLPLVRPDRTPFPGADSPGERVSGLSQRPGPTPGGAGLFEGFLRRLGVESFAWVWLGDCEPGFLARTLVPALFPDLLLVVWLRDERGEVPETFREDDMRRKLDALAGGDSHALTAAGVDQAAEWWVLVRLAAGLHWRGTLWRGVPGPGLEALQGRVAPEGAVLFLDPPAGQMLEERERRLALELARLTLETVVRTGRMPVVSPATLPLALLAPRACFVTLTRHGALRGCIGHLTAQMPLYQAVMENARNAALYDYRFEPVAPSELEELTIEISVLTRPRPLEVSGPEELLRCLEPGRDGVILRVGPHAGTFLPQVWEKIPDPSRFMEQLSLKAGCPPDAWRRPGSRVETYRVEAFSEPED